MFTNVSLSADISLNTAFLYNTSEMVEKRSLPNGKSLPLPLDASRLYHQDGHKCVIGPTPAIKRNPMTSGYLIQHREILNLDINRKL